MSQVGPEALLWMDPEDREQVQEWRRTWDARLRDAVTVTLHIRQWQPYATLTPERMERLGVVLTSPEAKAAFARTVKAGRIDLIPAEAYLPYQRAAGAARTNLASASHHLDGGYVVTPRAWPTWKERHAALEEDFWRSVGELCDGDNLEMLQAQMVEPYGAIFGDMYRRLKGGNLLDTDLSEDAWVDAAIFDLLGSVPSAEHVRQRFSWETTFHYCPMQDEVAQAEALAEKLRAEAALEIGALSEERRQIVTQMQAEVQAQAEARRTRAMQSLAEVEDTFYQSLQAAVVDLQGGMQERGQLLGRGAVQLKNIIEKVELLNDFGDSPLDDQVAALKRQLAACTGATVKTRESAFERLQQELNTLGTQVKSTLDNLPRRRGIRQELRDHELAVEGEAATVQRRNSTPAEVAVESPGKTRGKRRRLIPT